MGVCHLDPKRAKSCAAFNKDSGHSAKSWPHAGKQNTNGSLGLRAGGSWQEAQLLEGRPVRGPNLVWGPRGESAWGAASKVKPEAQKELVTWGGGGIEGGWGSGEGVLQEEETYVRVQDMSTQHIANHF